MSYLKSRLVKLSLFIFICFSFLFASLWSYLYWSDTSPAKFLTTNAPTAKVPTAKVPTAKAPKVATPTEDVTRWHIIFDDEFNGTSLDSNKWSIEDNASGGYQSCCLDYGMQYYTPQALSLSGGALHITTERANITGYNYTSGAITTEHKFSFLYGRIDVRAKLPTTQGFWPAFWLLPNGSEGIAPFEVDIMEFLGKDSHSVYMVNHWGKHQVSERYAGPDFSQQYHVFSVIWTPEAITWYIDGIPRFKTSQGISNQSMYLIINSTIGGRWSGKPDGTTILPQYMDIDYVRVYKPTS